MVWLFVTKKVVAANDDDSTDDTKDDNEEISRTSTTTEMDGSIEVNDDDIPIESGNIDSSTDMDNNSGGEQSIQVDEITNENKIRTNADVENYDNQSTKTDIDGDTIIQSTAETDIVSSNNKESEVILLDMDGTIIDTDESNDIQNEVLENEEQTLNGDGSTAVDNDDDTVQSTSGNNAEDAVEEMTDNISTDEPANKEKEKKLIILPSFGDDPIIDYPPPQQVINKKSNDEKEVEETGNDTQDSADEQVSSDSNTPDEDESQSADRTTSSNESQANATDDDETDSNTTKEGDESSTESDDNSTAASTTEEIEDDGPRQIKQVDYASKAAGAIILENSPSLEGASNLLTSDKDKYSIAPCADKKYVVISLSEDILVKQIKLSNYERYSSRVKEFQVLSSQEYPSSTTTTSTAETTTTSNNNNNEGTIDNNKDVWNTIGTYTVHSKSGEQTFELEEPSWARYLKFRFISHWGSEHYCTLSQIKVHGSTMLQGFHEQWIESENKINEEQEEVVVDESADQQQQEEVSDEDGEADTAVRDTHVEVEETDNSGDDVEKHGEQSSETIGTDEQVRTTESGEAEQLQSPDTVDTEEVGDSPPVVAKDDAGEVPQDIESRTEDAPDVAKGEEIVKGTSGEIKSDTPSEEDTPDEKESVDKQASDESNKDGEEQEHLTEQEEELSMDDASSSSSHIDTPDAINEDDLPKSSQIEEEEVNQYETIDDGDDHVKDESSISAAVTDASVTEESKDVIVGDENPSDSDEELDQAIQSKATETTKSHDTTTTNTDDSQPDTSAGEKSQSKGKLSTNIAEQKGDDSTVVKGSVAKVDTTSKETSKPVKKNIQKEKLKTAATKGGDMLKREAITHPSKDLGASVGELYAKLIRRFPHAKCLKDLDLQAFKSKSLLANAERSGGSSVGGGAPKMEPIFAKITNEIKSVQLQQTQYEQYISALKTCYESVFLDVAKDLDSTKGTDVEQRLASLERAVFLSEMTSKGGRSSYPSSHGLSSFFPTFPPFKVSPFQFSVPIYTMPTLEDHSTVIIGSLTAFLLATWLLLLRRKRKGGSTNVSRENTQHDVTLKKDKINGISNPNNILENELAETKNKLLDSDKKFRGLNSQHTSLQEEHEQLKQRYSQLEQTVRSMENEAEHMTPRRNNINVIPNENGHSSDVNTPTHSTSLPSSPSNKEE